MSLSANNGSPWRTGCHPRDKPEGMLRRDMRCSNPTQFNQIAAVVVWRMDNTAQAVFDVEDYGSYVEVQSESAIRSIASRYAHDHADPRGSTAR